MRAIKFRAWDKQINSYCNPDYIDCDGRCYDFQNREMVQEDTYLLEQFTGLHDCTGKEIYEGDLINATTCEDTEMVVVWSDKFASFCLRKEGWAYSHYFEEAIKPGDCKVVGTIHDKAT